MPDMFDGDEFDYISSHKKQLARQEAEKKEAERLAAEQAKREALARRAQLEENAEKSDSARKKPEYTTHPPYGRPYKADRSHSNAKADAQKKKAPMGEKVRAQGSRAHGADNARNEERRKQAQQEQKRLREQERAHNEEMRRKAQKQQQERRRQLEAEKQERERREKMRKELKARQREKDKQLRAAQRDALRDRRKARLIAYGARLATMIIVGLLLFAVTFAAFRITFGMSSGEDNEGYSYTVGGKSSSMKYEKAFRNGVLYICGDDIAAMCNLTVAGDEAEIKYISPGEGNESVSFKLNTRTAYVNKNEIRLSSEVFKDDNGRMYIPLEFFEEYMQGITVVNDELEREVSVSRVVVNQADVTVLGVDPVYADITFKVKPTYTINALDESVLNEEMPDFEYKIDISPFEEYINPQNIFEYVQIINENHPADGTFEYYDLIETTNQSVRNETPVKLRKAAAKALQAMLMEAKEDDVTRYAVFRGYVTYEQAQEDAESDRYVEKYGLPQYDENLLGLTAEVYFGDREDSYADSDVFEWFEENAHCFGFIVRYPEGGQEVTGVEFRPWTLRFVGRYSATKMYDEGITLEEYVDKYGLSR